MNRPLAPNYEPILLDPAPIDDDQFTAGTGGKIWHEFFGRGNAVSDDPTNVYNLGVETIFPGTKSSTFLLFIALCREN